MASSGWLGQQFIQKNGTNYIRHNVYVSSIVHSGTNVRITGTLEWYNTSGSISYSGAWVSCTGWGGTSFTASTRATLTWGFDVTLTGIAETTTSASFTMSSSAGSVYSGSTTWTVYFDASSVRPSGLSATLHEVGQDYAYVSGSLSSYGSPLSASRYMEVAVLGSSTYGAPYRYVPSATTATSMSSTKVSNSSNTNAQSPLTITPNTKYYYGAWATNGTVNNNVVAGSFITLPSSFTIVNTANEGNVVTVAWRRANEGNAATVTKEYSIDGGETWTTFTSNPFTFTSQHSGTLMLRATNSTGSCPIESVEYTAQSSRLYASVDGTAKLLDPVYIGVNGTAKKVTKLYIGDKNGVARKVIG